MQNGREKSVDSDGKREPNRLGKAALNTRQGRRTPAIPKVA